MAIVQILLFLQQANNMKQTTIKNGDIRVKTRITAARGSQRTK